MNVSKHCSRHVLIRSYLSRPLQITEKKIDLLSLQWPFEGFREIQ